VVHQGDGGEKAVGEVVAAYHLEVEQVHVMGDEVQTLHMLAEGGGASHAP
jgi:hypothetical protein